MSLLRLCQWLASTRGSIALHESLWGYPAIATVHMMALPLFVGMVAILDLRLLGVRMGVAGADSVAVIGDLFPGDGNIRTRVEEWIRITSPGGP